ncbi:MAG: 50S ribosomal protein L9 [Treponema sp.]|nr:50S ribosomal protein L9 [Treponema sp.]MBQ7882657.1 50S ribosomal protein L9 [Treponema sp.]
MKVILYTDVKHLGEMGDVKNVANGYARNYLFPHMYAVPYNPETVAYFESRKEEIAARKEQKRNDAASLKDKLEAVCVELTMPAGPNGKLYGSVSSQTISDYLNNNGFDIERKRIEIPGVAIKNTGNYHCTIHLYETTVAEVKISVKAQENEAVSEKKASKKEVNEKVETPAEEAKEE